MSPEQRALVARCRAAHEQAQRRRDEAEAAAKARGWTPGTEPPDEVVEARQAAGAAYCALDDALIGRTLPKPGIGSTTPGTIEEFREDADRIAGMLGKPLAAAQTGAPPTKRAGLWDFAVARHTDAFNASQIIQPKDHNARSAPRACLWDYAVAKHAANR